jgi:hypothetical protein
MLPPPDGSRQGLARAQLMSIGSEARAQAILRPPSPKAGVV